MALREAEALISRYLRYREIYRAQASELMDRVTRQALLAAAERLGVLADADTLALENQTEMDVFMDYLLLGYAPRTRTIAAGAVTKTRPRPGSDERVVLEAMAASRYSIYEVQRTRPGVALLLRDRIVGDELGVIDRNLSTTTRPGYLLAGRVAQLPELWMMTGGALPVDGGLAEFLLDTAESYREMAHAGPGRLPLERERAFGELATEMLLAAGMSEAIGFVPPQGHSKQRRR